MLVVSTVGEIKLFRLRLKPGSLKIQKLDAPLEIVKTGAKSIHFSPDQKWLAVVRINDSIQLYRITESGSSKKTPRLLTTTVHLKRLSRDPIKSNYQYGTLGAYDRSITRLAFSSDSRMFAVGDISGFLDTWVLEGHEDLTQDCEERVKSSRHSTTSDDEDSDEDSDEEQHAIIILGQHWIRNPSAPLLIKLPASPLILSFRPTSTQSTKALTNGSLGVHPTRHTPHPHSHDLPNGEDRLLVLTAENQLYEFNVLSGKLSDWSRRNPTSSLPQEFRDLRDRAMGVVWDVLGDSERIWLYGISWLWMFDLSRDLPASEDRNSKALLTNGEHEMKQLKRKRAYESEDDDFPARSRHDTGAGSRIAQSKLGLGIGPKVRKIQGDDKGGGKLITSAADQSSTSDEENDFLLANENDSRLISLRRIPDDSEDEVGVDGEPSTADEMRTTRRKAPRPSHWHTYKYRPILGIVPIGGESDDEAAEEGEGDSENGSLPSLEVALVERPLWEVDLPPQYHGDHEWNQ